jgi:D-alanyl-D-alanine carboxypeptidase
MNFDGNDNPEHVSTVYDLSQLGRASLKLNYVLNIVKEKQTLVTTIDGKDKYSQC